MCIVPATAHIAAASPHPSPTSLSFPTRKLVSPNVRVAETRLFALSVEKRITKGISFPNPLVHLSGVGFLVASYRNCNEDKELARQTAAYNVS
jgi:hypothetical protein